DQLFFQVLRLRAVQELLADPEFDHIIIATQKHAPASNYILTLSGIKGLTEDPRVELMSVAHSVVQRSVFSSFLPAIMAGPRPMPIVEPWLPPDTELAPQLWRYANLIGAGLSSHPVSESTDAEDVNVRKSVLIATTITNAYNFSTARYAAALSQEFRTGVVVCGGSAATLHSEISDADVSPRSISFNLLPGKYLPKQTLFARWLKGKIGIFCAERGRENSIAHMISCSPDHLVANIIQSQLLHGMVLESWFAKMAQDDGLPDAIVLSAARTPNVSQFSATARRYNVPTLSLEAHGLNANYCRYLKVGTDFYGVIAEKFRRDADWGFSIGPDRTRVVGTPRIVASPGRHQDEARAEIEADLEHDFPTRPGGAISFFSQPSSWTHVSQVWRLILAAANDLDLQILLKPHPEETVSRIGQYDMIARQMSAEDRVQLISAKPSVLIEASDVVLTGYSTAALDAAVMGRPVICVTAGDAAYPLEQHEIARAPLVGDLDGLCHALQSFLTNPEAAREAYLAFRAAEPQFFEGPDDRLRGFVADMIAHPNIRPMNEVPQHFFLEPPHPTFSI
ncbi:MAG: hypothetical protein ACRC2W_01570, partial [Plesiomonas shigelloides]